MSESFIKDLLTTYGPLGLGWIFAVLLFLRNQKLTDRLIDSTAAVNALTERVEKLSSTVMLMIGNPVRSRGDQP